MFSKAQISKRQKEPSTEIKCKQCVEAAAAQEREAAAARQAARAA